MSKKIWYSTPLSFYWNELYSTQKKITPYLTDEQIYNCLKYNLVNAPLAPTENLESRDLVLVGLEIWKEDYLKNLLHIFFKEKKLKEFLENMPLSDLNGIKKYLYENGENKKVIYVKTKSQADCVTYSFGLHIPYETDGYAFTFNVYQNESLEFFYTRGKYQGGLPETLYLDLLKKNDEKSNTLTKIFRLAINTIAYMKCFPECVIDGVPMITIDRNEKRTNNNVIFKMSEKIVEDVKPSKSIIPHRRSAYFKYLSSDFYTHKQGKLVYVRETMVNGKAKTIYTSDKIDEVKSLNEE